MKTKFLIIFALIVAILSVLFAFQNTQIGEVHFLRWQFEAPVVLLLLLSFGVGFLLALVLTVPAQMWDKTKVWGLRWRVKSLVAKVEKGKKVESDLETEKTNKKKD
jgi:uncharacterized integral membrane protein